MVGSFVVHACQTLPEWRISELELLQTYTNTNHYAETHERAPTPLLCVGALLQNYTGISSTSFSFLQERAGCKMQMIQDGQFANAPEKPLRMTGLPESCKVLTTLVLYVDHYVRKSEITWVDFFWRI